MSEQSVSGSKRLWTLDVFRGVAILAVIVFHVLPDQSDVRGFYFLGTLGVSSFFCLSGFSVHLSQLRQQARQGQEPINWKSFFIQRFWRLYPPYVGAIGCAIALNVLWALLRHRHAIERLPSLPDLLSHLLLLHSLHPDTIFGIVPAFWFVGVLAHLYLLYPAFVGLAQRLNYDLALWVVLGVTMLARYFSAQIELPISMNLEAVVWNTALHRWFEWCCGAWMAERYYRGLRPNSPCWLVLLLVGVWCVIGGEFKLYYEPVFGLLLGGLIGTLSCQTAKQHLIWKPFIAIGQLSYSLYLLHQLFIPYLRSPLLHVSMDMGTHIGVLLPLTLLITIPVAHLYHQVFQKIALKFTPVP